MLKYTLTFLAAFVFSAMAHAVAGEQAPFAVPAPVSSVSAAGTQASSATAAPNSSDTAESARASASGAISVDRETQHYNDSIQEPAQEDSWQRHYRLGLAAYKNRLFVSAGRHLEEALKQTRNGNLSSKRLVLTRIALGELYLSKGRITLAEQMLKSSAGSARREFGEQSLQTAQSLNGLAAIALTNSRFKQAETLSRQALSVRQKLLPPDHAAVGQSLHILGMALSEQMWFDQANPILEQSLAIMGKNPGPGDLDLAEVLRDVALSYQAQGRKEESAKLFGRALTIKERSIRLDLPPAIAGVINFPWDEGSPGSGQIVDGEYPLKFMTVGGLRIATTVVPSMQMVDVLISLKNTSGEPVDLGVGPVTMAVVKPRYKRLERLAPESIDWVLEENTVWNWTHRQPSLAILQQNTMDPSVTPQRAPACVECAGGNLWGRYGRWEVLGSTHNTIAKNRLNSQIESILLSGEVKWDTIRALDVSIVRVGPGESRSGLVFFFSNPHSGDAVIRIFIGNASFDFPFRITG